MLARPYYVQLYWENYHAFCLENRSFSERGFVHAKGRCLSFILPNKAVGRIWKVSVIEFSAKGSLSNSQITLVGNF